MEHKYGNQKAWEFNFALFEAFFIKNLVLVNKSIIETAESIGLEGEPVKEVFDSNAYLKEVLDDENYAHSHGIHSIPTFVFNNKFAIHGSMPLNGFKEALKDLYKRLK